MHLRLACAFVATPDFTDDLRLAHVLADDADSLTTARFKALDLHVMSKPDLTPVTDADQAVEESIRRTLSRARSRDAITGEEQGTTGNSQRRWIIDPIDGTKNFVRGVPVWATLISLVVDDEVVVGVNGYFGGRLADIAARCGAKVTTVESDWGDIIRPEQIATALETVKPKLVAIVHAETSTGVLTPVEEISRLVHEAGALLVLDTVTSLGGCPVRIDDWQIDAAYSASQKCLGSACGVAPVTLSPRAMEAVANRQTPVQSFYLDVNLLQKYWAGSPRAYHHTAPILMNYALHEALRLVLEEGLEARWARHEANHRALAAGLAEQGLELGTPEAIRLWQLNPVRVPEGVDEATVRLALLNDHNLEVGPGLGPYQGKVWRIGLMGYSSSEENVDRVLAALKALL